MPYLAWTSMETIHRTPNWSLDVLTFIFWLCIAVLIYGYLREHDNLRN
jgi:hypothetical protein